MSRLGSRKIPWRRCSRSSCQGRRRGPCGRRFTAMCRRLMTPPSSEHRHDGLAARTRSPTAPAPRVPRGTSRSVREPKRIMPEALARRELVARAPPGTRCAARPRRRSGAPLTRRCSPCEVDRAPLVHLRRLGPIGGDEAPARVPTSTTTPAMGARFTCTSSGDRKMDNAHRRAHERVVDARRPPSPGRRPGPASAPGNRGVVRSGSRKNPRNAARRGREGQRGRPPADRASDEAAAASAAAEPR